MVRYLGPKVKIVRRLGILPGLTGKISKLRKKGPGQHGKRLSLKNQRTSLSGDFRERLLEKQKLRYNYGLTEKQLIKYYQIAKKKKSSTGAVLLTLLESRLDSILYRLGFAPTINAARQFITHRHVYVNKCLVNIPSFLCKKGDFISVNERPISQNLIHFFFNKIKKERDLIMRRAKEIKLAKQNFKYIAKSLLPSYLRVEEKPLRGFISENIKRKDIGIRVNELKVIEYYSR